MRPSLHIFTPFFSIIIMIIMMRPTKTPRGLAQSPTYLSHILDLIEHCIVMISTDYSLPNLLQDFLWPFITWASL
ncbi:hypothetical protein P167DRAFT_322619 [Morchella conica CCBAS932]|uniref:Uncharacterized protein n=1 Tax=Morchella conica CCBAS932 TaxID=1392247 RepID=A0A3N4KTJ0_9PEZI|nr:hypothetical protein P167DRAFT_322619 [Morchella conica CCBAS932]